METYIATMDFNAWPPEPGEKVLIARGTRLKMEKSCLYSADFSMPNGTLITLPRQKADGHDQYFAQFNFCMTEAEMEAEAESEIAEDSMQLSEEFFTQLEKDTELLNALLDSVNLQCPYCIQPDIKSARMACYVKTCHNFDPSL